MAIEFTCRECSCLLKVPDGTAGQACECPSCQAVMDIPNTADDVVEAQIIEDDLLAIPCPKCLKVLRCAPDLLGTKGQCKGCKHIFVISTDPAEAEAEQLWVFECPKCAQLFDGQEEMRGRKGKCHACGEVFAIELKPAEPSTEKSASSATPASGEPIQLACGACQGVMEVPADAAGCTAECPFCQALLEIPG